MSVIDPNQAGIEETTESVDLPGPSRQESDTTTLDGLVERLCSDAAAAFEPAVLEAAASLEQRSPRSWFELKRAIRSSLSAAGGSLREWERAIASYKRTQRDAERAASSSSRLRPEFSVDPCEPHARVGFGYDMQPGSLSREGRSGEQLAGFSALIAKERVVFDGAEEQREYELSVHVGDERKQVSVAAKDFASMAWVPALLGARAWLGAGRGTADEVRLAIQRLSGAIPCEEAYSIIGWHKHRNGQWHFHHAGGAIGARGVAAQIGRTPRPRFASLYELPAPPTGDALVRAVLAAAECFVLHDAVSAAVFSLVWRSILGPTQASIHLSGEPASGKSELASIAQRHFGAAMDRRNLPMSWRLASDNALARARNLIGDSVLVIDDLVVRGARDEERIAERVDTVFRGGWNGQGTERLTRDGAVRAARPPRSAVLSTGELVPRGLSLRQRVFVVDVERSETNYRLGIEAAETGLLASAIAAATQWLAPSMDDVRSTLDREDLEAARPFASLGDRTSQVAGALSVGVDTFARFAVAVGAMRLEDAEQMACWTRERIESLARAQIGVQSEEDPARRFRALVLDAIATGRAHVTRPDGASPPESPSSWGWKPAREQSAPDAAGDGLVAPARLDAWHAQGDRIGQIHPDHRNVLLLDPGPALDVARAIATRRGNSLPFSATRELAQRLHRAGLLARTELDKRQTYTCRLRVAGRAVERLWLVLEDENEGAHDDQA